MFTLYNVQYCITHLRSTHTLPFRILHVNDMDVINKNTTHTLLLAP